MSPPQPGTDTLPSGGLGNDLVVCHIALPFHYINTNWPLMHTAISPNGMDVAVAGRRGLALYSRAADKWRLFGDVSQERQVSWSGAGSMACVRAQRQVVG